MAGNMGMWELPSLNYRNPPMGPSMNNSFGHSPVYNNSSMINTSLGRVFTSPPPLPARPVRNSYNGYNSFSSPFNSYGGGYGCYGDYRPGFNSYRFGSGYYGGYGNSYPESRFIQLAEESSRPAFQTIQSILQAFSSVTIMFESSFHAIYSSYMSVLGVADNFGKLRSAFSQIFSTFAVIKTLNWIFKKLCCMLGVNTEKYMKDVAWSEALNDKADVSSGKTSKKQTWPLLLFMSILIGGPYLLFKLMSEIYPQPVPDVWVPSEQPGSLAIGMYDFHAASVEELSFSAQQKLMIAPKKYQPNDCPGWLLACDENRKTGLIPSNYVGMLMQSEKTGETYIQHNGQTYQHPVKNLNNSKNSFKRQTNEETSSEKKSEDELVENVKVEKGNNEEENEL